jgi:hypothetical protein
MDTELPVLSELSRAYDIPVSRVENAFAVMFSILLLPDIIPDIAEYIEECVNASNKKRVKNFLLLLDKYIKEDDEQKKDKHFKILLTSRNASDDLIVLMYTMKLYNMPQKLLEIAETELADGNITEGDYLEQCNDVRDMYSVTEMIMTIVVERP